jgi:hypothetical protein
MGFDSFKERRSLFAGAGRWRRIRRSDPMELLEGASEWARPPHEKLQATKDFR